MASPEILDFDRLLAPVSEEAPAGVELKDASAEMARYYEVKDAAEAARTAERQLVRARLAGDDEEAVSIGPPDWKRVRDLAIEVIADKSKDLWIAAWLVEALAREHGFAGLRDGFRLVRELAERYWDDIHPRPDEDGYVHTVAQLTGLNGDDSEGALIAPIEAIPITQGTSERPLTSADYKQAAELEQTTDADRRAQRIAQGAVTMQMFERAVAETPPEFFQELIEDIEQAIREFERMGEVLDERCGQNEDGYPAAPPTSNIHNALEGCRDRVRSLARHVLEGAEAEREEEASDAAAAQGAQPSASTGKITTREDAFRTLLQVADFFRRTEPHSPVPYALEQVVRWGRMSLPELMAELISDESVRDDLARRVGIPKVEPAESD